MDQSIPDCRTTNRSLLINRLKNEEILEAWERERQELRRRLFPEDSSLYLPPKPVSVKVEYSDGTTRRYSEDNLSGTKGGEIVVDTREPKGWERGSHCLFDQITILMISRKHRITDDLIINKKSRYMGDWSL